MPRECVRMFCRIVSQDGGIWGTGGHSLPEKVMKKKRKADGSDGERKLGAETDL